MLEIRTESEPLRPGGTGFAAERFSGLPPAAGSGHGSGRTSPLSCVGKICDGARMSMINEVTEAVGVVESPWVAAWSRW